VKLVRGGKEDLALEIMLRITQDISVKCNCIGIVDFYCSQGETREFFGVNSPTV
jgi:hypothetical protein